MRASMRLCVYNDASHRQLTPPELVMDNMNTTGHDHISNPLPACSACMMTSACVTFSCAISVS